MKAKKKDVQIRSKRKRLEGELEKERIEKPQDEIDVYFQYARAEEKRETCSGVKECPEGIWWKELFADVSFTVQAGERIGLDWAKWCWKVNAVSNDARGRVIWRCIYGKRKG